MKITSYYMLIINTSHFHPQYCTIQQHTKLLNCTDGWNPLFKWSILSMKLNYTTITISKFGLYKICTENITHNTSYMYFFSIKILGHLANMQTLPYFYLMHYQTESSHHTLYRVWLKHEKTFKFVDLQRQDLSTEL